MSQQKAFYEIEKPPRKEYAIMVQLREKQTPTPCHCQHLEAFYDSEHTLNGYFLCRESTNSLEFSQCDHCERWFCDDHLSDDPPTGWQLCVNCIKLGLSTAELEQLEQFETDFNKF